MGAGAELPADTAMNTPEFFPENIGGGAFRQPGKQLVLVALVGEWGIDRGSARKTLEPPPEWQEVVLPPTRRGGKE